MSEQEKKNEKAYEALDRIGQKWPVPIEGNEALIEALIFEAWPYIQRLSKAALGTYSEDIRESAAADATLALRQYDRTKKKLGGFVIDRINWSLRTEYARANKYTEEPLPDSEDASDFPARKKISTVSLDAPVPAKDGTEVSLGDITESPQLPPEDQTEILGMYLDTISSMTAVVLNFKEMEGRGGKKAKYAVQNRVCFTEQITCRMKDNASTRYLRQQDILHALYREYLGYFAEHSEKIQSLEDMRYLTLQKEFRWNKKVSPEKELSFDCNGWLTNKVPKGFLNEQGISTSDSQVTEMRNRYMDEVRGVLMEKYRYAKSDFAQGHQVTHR